MPGRGKKNAYVAVRIDRDHFLRDFEVDCVCRLLSILLCLVETALFETKTNPILCSNKIRKDAVGQNENEEIGTLRALHLKVVHFESSVPLLNEIAGVDAVRKILGGKKASSQQNIKNHSESDKYLPLVQLGTTCRRVELRRSRDYRSKETWKRTLDDDGSTQVREYPVTWR